MPNACVYRARATALRVTMRTALRRLRCNALLGDARKHNPCHPLMPLAVVHRDVVAFFLRLPSHPASGFAPFPPRCCLAISLALARAVRLRPQDGCSAKLGVGSPRMRSTVVRGFETMPSLVMAIAG